MKKPKLSAFVLKHKRIVACFGFLITFIIGFTISDQVFFLEMNEQEYKVCEEVAYNIYNQMQEHPLQYEVPDNIKVKVSNTKIIVSTDNYRFGRVIAYIENNELVTKREVKNVLCTLGDITSGIFFVFVFDTIFNDYIKKQERRSFNI